MYSLYFQDQLDFDKLYCSNAMTSIVRSEFKFELLKIVHADQRKYKNKTIYNMTSTDIELTPNKQNWASIN